MGDTTGDNGRLTATDIDGLGNGAPITYAVDVLDLDLGSKARTGGQERGLEGIAARVERVGRRLGLCHSGDTDCQDGQYNLPRRTDRHGTLLLPRPRSPYFTVIQSGELQA